MILSPTPMEGFKVMDTKGGPAPGPLSQRQIVRQFGVSRSGAGLFRWLVAGSQNRSGLV
jgi:hypothetical protein